VVSPASKEEAPKVTEDSFDPWEAYYKPGSPSYEMRVEQEKSCCSTSCSRADGWVSATDGD
jgi:hypothetical protein